MAKSHHKKISPPPKPISRRYTLYAQNTASHIASALAFIVFFAFGIGALLEQQYLVSLIPFIGAGVTVYSKFTEVQKLDIFENSMFIEYLDSSQTYRAEDIESIEWKSALVLGSDGGPNAPYQYTPVLVIQIRNGKKIQLPPPGGFDIQKSLLEWRDKYKTPRDDQVIVNK
jgi:hypothetical protein